MPARVANQKAGFASYCKIKIKFLAQHSYLIVKSTLFMKSLDRRFGNAAFFRVKTLEQHRFYNFQINIRFILPARGFSHIIIAGITWLKDLRLITSLNISRCGFQNPLTIRQSSRDYTLERFTISVKLKEPQGIKNVWILRRGRVSATEY